MPRYESIMVAPYPCQPDWAVIDQDAEEPDCSCASRRCALYRRHVRAQLRIPRRPAA